MKNSMFSGYTDVFLFTLKQGATKKYKMSTLIMALILLLAGFAINVLSAMGQKDDDNISPIEKVYVIDESGLSNIQWSKSKLMDKEQFPKVSFEQSNSDIKELGLELKDKETTSIIVHIGKTKDSYEIKVYIPYGSEVDKNDGKNIASVMKDILREGVINESGIDSETISYATSSVDTEFCTVGEDAKSDNMRIITAVLPMVFMLGIYFMVIIYGQSMGHIVSIEKSSKLMETLLVMTRPYGLIFGKILATAAIAIFQIAVWGVAAIGGFLIGDSFARDSIYSAYDNGIISMIKDIAAEETVDAFSIEAIILCVVAICLAFLFYCMLAGAISSFASKADELGSVMMFYNMFLIVGFMGSYVLPNTVGQEWIKILVRIIPVSSAFLLPGEIIVGTITSGAAIIYLIVLLAWIIVTAVFAGKVYKDQLFHRGKSLRERLPWGKKSKAQDDEEQWQLLHDESGRPIEKSQKIGYFFLAISTFVIFFAIQILASFVLTNIMTRTGLKGIDLSTWETKDFVDFYHGIENVLNPLTMMVCHMLIITTFGLWMYFIRRGINRNNIVHIKSLKSKNVVAMLGLCLVSGICLCLLANGVVAVEGELIPSVLEDYLEMAKTSGFGVSPFAIFAAVCLAPIGEEFLCRGICLHFGKKAFGKFWYANILQSLLFGALHMNWVQGVYAFFIGLVLGVIVERYDSLLPAMLVHFVVNFSSTTWISKVFSGVNITLPMGIMMIVIPGMITVTSLGFANNKMNS